MDNLFDEINDFILSVLGIDKKRPSSGKGAADDKTNRRQYTDPDMQSAWDELEDYLRGEKNTGESQRAGQEQRTGRGTNQNAGPTDYATYQKEKEREKLRQDYANLEVPYGSSFEKVKKAFKVMLIKYHPDKHVNNPEKSKVATQITQKINASFQNIKAFEERHSSQKK